MKRLLTLIVVVMLLTASLVFNTPYSHAQLQSGHSQYLIGLSPQVTVTIQNAEDFPIAVSVIPLGISGVQTGIGAQQIDIAPKAKRELKVSELPAGTVSLRIDANGRLDAYAYDVGKIADTVDFIPALSGASTNLTFPQFGNRDLQTKSIVLFNTTDQAGSADLIVFNSSGVEVMRAYAGPLLPMQTIEIVPGNLISIGIPDDVTLVVRASVALVARQRVTLPRGEKISTPGFPNNAGATTEAQSTKATGNANSVSLVNVTTTASLDDYPYKTSPFCPSNVSTCPSNTIDPYNFFFRECTSFVAWRMNRDAGTTDPSRPSFTNTMRNGHWGNGGNWSVNAAKLNYRVDKVAEVGAVAQWNANECSGCNVGHVAYVESVNANGTVNLSEYNYSVGHGYGFRQNVAVSSIGRFIHITAPANNGSRPMVSSNIRITTSGPFTVNQAIQITFSITNRGNQPITFQKLLAGGRRDGDPNCTAAGCPDFPALTNLTLNPNQTVTYTQTQSFATADRYNFFVAYLTNAGWVTNVAPDAGVINSIGITINPRAVPPTLAGYTWNSTPRANQPFNGTITGSGFVPGATQVWFCVSGSSSCYQQPASGVSVNNTTSLSVTNVSLASGQWQIFVQTAAGASTKSSAFVVQSAIVLPTISGYSWTSTPTANRPFSGAVTGNGFVVGGTQVWFCLAGTSSCYQQPAAGVSVISSSTVAVSNVNLGAGAWNIYVQTAAGQSTRSSTFAVTLGPPTLSGFSWSPTPSGSQPFGGSITGTGFVAGATSVWFCRSGSSTCYQQPSSGISVDNSNSLSVTNVRLASGSWQVYVSTPYGTSIRSNTFTIR